MKYIANTAENIFRTDKVLIISWPYQYNCTDIDLSKTALSLENRQHPCLLMNALPVSHPSETSGVQLRASMPALEKGEVARLI